ncbi:hypothetical protein HPB51_012202 [Rhipicephalus microplus]|uniref:Lysosomal alpha-mannosidase-like central domain-containing protein n=1 Tax=Rhipicephalus microplus TaxID=6941 RepID=A0A9J6E954_RHIMP|nr:hypothetical protein HPB51_012202 [Rhipicephalus microplus]
MTESGAKQGPHAAAASVQPPALYYRVLVAPLRIFTASFGLPRPHGGVASSSASRRRPARTPCLYTVDEPLLARVPKRRFHCSVEHPLAHGVAEEHDIYPVQADPMATVLLNYANRQANTYNNDTVAMMSGGDLAFVRGDCRFQRQDAFIGEANRISLSTNKRPPVHVVHSTPACYVEALRAKSRTWPHFSGDLLPYTDKPGRTWTGFYTTRPSQKMLVRYANGFLQVSGSAAGNTGKRLVSTTLVSLLDPGILRTGEVAKRLSYCHLINQSDCDATTTDSKTPQFAVVIYNPASVTATPYLRLPLSTDNSVVVSVSGPRGATIESQVVPLGPHRHKIPESKGTAKSSLVFQANVPPLGASIYHVRGTKAAATKHRNFLEIHEQDNFIENQAKTSVKLHQSFGAYAFGSSSPDAACPPGHYVFSAYSEARDMGDHVTHRVIKVSSPVLRHSLQQQPDHGRAKDRTKGLQMMILPDRTQGGSSLRSGQLELMVHRSHGTNDNLGVGESLQEIGGDGAGLVVKGTHRLFLGSIVEAGQILRPQALQLVYRPLVLFAPAGWKPSKEKVSGLRAPLPATIHLLTLERLSANKVLLRLEHLGITKSVVMLNVTRLLVGHLLRDLQPLTLAANQFLSNATRDYWPTAENSEQRPEVKNVRMTAPELLTVTGSGDNVLKLKPRQIITFQATLVTE